MGGLHRFEINRYREQYGLTSLFETGTFHGTGVQEALDAEFERIYSAEIIDQYFDENVERFSDRENVILLKGHSVDVLDSTLPDIDGNMFFWLDAHFPGADGGLRGYNEEPDQELRCPLEAELRVIRKHRAGRADVILMDDLQIYEDGPFESGGMPAHVERPPNANFGFVYELFGDTHHIIKLYYDEGYVLMLPIEEMPKLFVRRFLHHPDGDVVQLIASRLDT